MKQSGMRVLVVYAVRVRDFTRPGGFIFPVDHSVFRSRQSVPGGGGSTLADVWYTLPAQNAIGNLVVTSPGVYEVHTYPMPMTDSEPYDIAFAAGAVWVTEHLGNKIARFDPLTRESGRSIRSLRQAAYRPVW